MNNYKARSDLYKKWMTLRNYINAYADKISYDRATKLREQQDKYFKEWEKLTKIEKLEKILKEREKGNENNIRKRK